MPDRAGRYDDRRFGADMVPARPLNVSWLYLPMSRDLVAQFEREQLHRAAQDGDLARVNDLIGRKYPLNRFDELGMTPLHHAVKGNHLEVVKRLIEAGVNVNAHDGRVIGNTPLSDNVRECTYEMAKVLIDAGADPTIRSWMQMNAVDRARQRNDASARKILRLLEETATRRPV
jgi:ankyrin repeat protein